MGGPSGKGISRGIILPLASITSTPIWVGEKPFTFPKNLRETPSPDKSIGLYLLQILLIEKGPKKEWNQILRGAGHLFAFAFSPFTSKPG